ncbi:MAG: hypothetical protein Q9167_004384 [Letrouitia subvulpina]
MSDKKRYHAQKYTVRKIAEKFNSVNEDIADGYRSMLEKLGVELYSEDTHFVYELIQNADDNKYANKTIKVQCNEKGFTEEDVNALCNVSKSTKKSRETIGEKGIGFKSVFKIADEVYIGSNGFQFVLSKENGAFGMVQPEWRKFKDWSEFPDVTLLRLSLSADCKASMVHEELEDLKPTVLLFLRKISKISIDTPNFQKEMSCFGRGEQLVTLKTTTRYHAEFENDDLDYSGNEDDQYSQGGHDDSDDRDDSESNNEDDGSDTQQFFVKRAEAECEQPPPLGKTSIISLAFPKVGKEALDTQDVHAFLPIRDYGFKFIIQADFSLTSSREEIDHTSEWNQALRDSIYPIFKAAVDEMNKLSPYRFIWMRYLPNPDLPNSFLSELQDGKITIKDHLIKEPCLYSQNQKLLHTPAMLIYMPAKFRSRRKKPLFYKMAGRRGLSFNYQERDIPTIIDLGVHELDMDLFIGHMMHIFEQDWLGFTQHAPDWHEDLAKTLLEADSERLLTLPLIPLEGPKGEWISAKDLKSRNVFLKPQVKNTQIPSGIDIDFVQTTATRNPARLALIQRLGVNSCDETAICSAITRILNFSEMPALEVAVAQTKYLFEHRSTFSTPNIKFWSRRAEPAEPADPIGTEGNRIYFDDDRQTYPISTLLRSTNIFHLHPRYFKSPPTDSKTDWLNWLIECQLATVPRIVSKGLIKVSHVHSSPDFLKFLYSSDLACIIEVLVQNWDFYEPNFRLVSSHIKAILCGTVLPLPNLLWIAQKYGLKATDKKFLQVKIKEIEVTRYQKFECFGVCVNASGTFYLELLHHLKDQLKMPEVGLVHSVYRELQQSPDRYGIKSRFFDRHLIAITVSPASGRITHWLSANSCFWNGPTSLRCNSGLLSQYEDCEEFFCDILRVQKNATLEHVVEDIELTVAEMNDRLLAEDLRPLIITLSEYIKRSVEDNDQNVSKILQRLRFAKIFPLRDRRSLRLACKSEFSAPSFCFVADRVDLYELFKNHVPLLDFSSSVIHKLKPLFDYFLEPRLLSNAVRKDFIKRGNEMLDSALTSDYRKNSTEIFRCVRHYNPFVHDRLHEKIQNLTVIEVDSVECNNTLYEDTWRQFTFFAQKPPKISISTSGGVAIENSSEGIKIFITKDRSLRQKALCHTIPERLISEFGLRPEAQAMLQTVLLLEQPLLGGILYEHRIPRLPGHESATDRNGSGPSNQVSQNKTASVIERVETLSRTTSNFALPFTFRSRDAPPSPSIIPTRDTAPLPSATSATVPASDIESLTGPSTLHLSIKRSAENFDFNSVQIISTFNMALPEAVPPRVDSTTIAFSHSTIGFLGELFVVSILTKFVPGFRPSSHWTSRLRKRAQVCSGFEDISAYEEVEVADITYHDEHGKLARWLHQQGYNDALNWVDGGMTFYLEVKTTIRECTIPFIMSAGQIEHARRFTKYASDQSSYSRYLIIRVFRILDECRNMRVYVDPHALIKKGQLEKSARQYSIVPARHETSALEACDEDDEGTSSDTEEEYDGAST